ncbi:MAG: TIGR00725 family protein [Candidatus Cloacimonetes bacterium]|nr:TIGR00725 family protein [Candidatus Cloacimonadota bacterium]
MEIKQVAVIGQSGVVPQHLLNIAYEIGKGLAERKITLICGGRDGVMEATCKGAAEAGGLTIGILPGLDKVEGNNFLMVVIPTGIGFARNSIVASAGDIVIAIGGSFGTLNALTLAKTNEKTIIGVQTWTATSHNGKNLDILRADTAEKALSLLDSLMSEKQATRY